MKLQYMATPLLEISRLSYCVNSFAYNPYTSLDIVTCPNTFSMIYISEVNHFYSIYIFLVFTYICIFL